MNSYHKSSLFYSATRNIYFKKSELVAIKSLTPFLSYAKSKIMSKHPDKKAEKYKEANMAHKKRKIVLNCKKCNGTGIVNERICPECDGRGYRIVGEKVQSEYENGDREMKGVKQ